ncbi:MAG: protein of unknown function duf20, partial [Akkermansiaceae bacterium]|nr:protein of unknown function duf20 [Akkermansiaceae bacterium]
MARYPTRFQTRTMWNAISGISMLVLGALIVGLIWLAGQILGFLQPVVVPLAVAAIVAYLLDPIVRMIQRRGFSRRWAVVGVFAGFTLLMGGLIAIMIPLIGGQIHKFQQQREAVASAAHETVPEVAPEATAAEVAAKKPIDEFVIDRLVATRTKHEWTKPFVDPLLDRPGSKDPDAPPVASRMAAYDIALKNGEKPDPIVASDTALWAKMNSYMG